MPDLRLQGCTPEPLMSYLKALGVFRLVAEDRELGDPNAQLFWRGGVAHLESRFTRDELMTFFLEGYSPTPIVAPWNGGSGFYGGGSEPLEAIARSRTNRLATYRDTITRIREFVPESKPKDDQKDQLLIQCRSELCDRVIPWLDVCFVLGEKGPSFFPLLGTGGNDGRLDFTNNFMQRLADVLVFDADGSKEGAKDLLTAALFLDRLVSLEKAAVGQFNPGGTGGANGTQGKFEAGSRVNPWDFILMVEGTLLFAGSVARRMGAYSTGRAVFPFSVDSLAVGYGSATASEETTDGSRAELWLPLWDKGFTLAEVSHLFGEGRAQIGRRQARNAVEFALAVNLLGVNRGVSSFARYGFLKRNGLAFLASPLGRVEVQPRPRARLLDDPPLVQWIDRLRAACRDKDRTPARYQTALRYIDRATFAFANRSGQGNDAGYLLDVIAALGRAERVLAGGLSFCKEKYISPLQGLSPQWLEQADDGSPEFRLAVALAGIGLEKEHKVGPLRVFLEEVQATKFVKWSPGSTSAVWSKQPLASNLAAVFRRRQMEAFRAGLPGVPLATPRPARLDDVIAFLHGATDDEKLSDLVWGLLGIRWGKVAPQRPIKSERRVPTEFGIPRLLVQKLMVVPKLVRLSNPRPNRPATRVVWRITKMADRTTSDLKARNGINRASPKENGVNVRPDPNAFHALASGQPNAVGNSVDRAARQLKSGGLLVTGYRNRRQAGKPLTVVSLIHPERLLAAMLFPLTHHDLERIANAVLYPPQSEEE